jgi:hypothetical protein
VFWNLPWHDYLATGLATLGCVFLALYAIARLRAREATEEYGYEEEGLFGDDPGWAAAIKDQLRTPGRFSPGRPLWRDEPDLSPDWATSTLVGFGRWRSELESELRDWRRDLVTQLPE